jgi:DNA-binding transcriptional LysR family regulator
VELIQLISFYHIVKTGSFSRASENVFRSQSAVSHQIKNLEKDFNVILFERLGKKVRLTAEGEMLFTVVSTFLNDIDNLKRIYADMQCGGHGKLILAVSGILMTYWFKDVIRLFVDQFPAIKFKLFTVTDASVMQKMILNGEVDFGIGMKDQIISKKLSFLSWKFFDRVLMADKDHPLCTLKTITLRDIAGYPLILTRLGRTKNVVEQAFEQSNLGYEIVMEMDLPEMIKKFLVNTMNVSIFSSIALTEEDKSRMAVFNVRHLFGEVEYGLYCSKDKYVSNVMKQFVNFAIPEIADQLNSYKVR